MTSAVLVDTIRWYASGSPPREKNCVEVMTQKN